LHWNNADTKQNISVGTKQNDTYIQLNMYNTFWIYKEYAHFWQLQKKSKTYMKEIVSKRISHLGEKITIQNESIFEDIQ